jgi:transposase
MSKLVVSDELKAAVEPPLPEDLPKPKGRCPRVLDRAALTGILCVAQSGIPWEMPPREMGCGSGCTGRSCAARQPAPMLDGNHLEL